MRRVRERDEGFTLIELMMVVLIIAILLAVAIPTFLGARERANDRAAQSDARNANTNALVYYADRQEFTSDPATMRALDPSLIYTNTHALMRNGQVYIQIASTNRANDTVYVGVHSKSGLCFWIRTVGDSSYPRFAENDCTATPPDASFVDEWD